MKVDIEQLDKRIGWGKITTIEEVGVGDYYDLEVPFFENYVANGFINHNSSLGTDEPTSRPASVHRGVRIPAGLSEEGERQYRDVVSAYTNRDGSKKPGWMKGPDGEKTKLDERQWVQVRTPEFKKFFGDWENDPKNASKVVDSNGEPLVVYHGSSKAGFSEFDDLSGNKNPQVPAGTNFFTDNRRVARSYSGSNDDVIFIDPDEYGERETMRGIYPVFLNIRNADTVSFGGANWDGKRIGYEVFDPSSGDYIYHNDSVFFEHMDDVRAKLDELGLSEHEVEIIKDPDIGESTNSVAANAKREGKDGAIIYDVTDNGGLLDSYDVSTVYVAFNSEQIKSATDNNGDFSGEKASILNAGRKYVEPGFYSALQEGIEAKMPGRASAEQVLNIARSVAKPEELKWSDLDTFLAGKGTVTKQEVLDYLRDEGKVEFREKILGNCPHAKPKRATMRGR